MNNPELQRAAAEQDRQDQITNSTLATVLSMLLMPAGALMDHFVYPTHAWFFFKLRLCSSVLVGIVWLWFMSPIGRKHYRIFGVMWYAIPTTFILWMIYAANDPFSPYYAGLNIVLLALGLLSPWTYKQNLVSSALIIAVFLGICHFMPVHQQFGSVVNNLYFMSSIALIVVAGSVKHSRLRAREFELRYALDQSKQMLEEGNRKLVELDQVKSRFFANISHELRTPLTLLLAPLETLQNRYKGKLDDQTLNLFSTMHANGMRLLKLINDLLDLVRLESGRMEIKHEPMAVSEFVMGLASAARQVAEDKKLNLETSVDPALGTIQADRDKLEKVLLNLIFNALKFTPAGGRVTVRAEKLQGEMVITVQDTGMGIAEKNLPFVFDRFWQADGSSKRKYQGVGIGLSLVKELVEIQGGKVSVISQEGKGATFTIRLPYTPADPAMEKRPQEPAREAIANGTNTVTSEEWLSNLYRRAELFPAIAPVPQMAQAPDAVKNGSHATILIADDEPDMLRFLKSQLNQHYHIVDVVNGQQAVEKATEVLPDLILLDMMMPEKDGMQACRELRENASTQTIPVILLTARADEETKLAALSAGANDFLAKPFSTTELHIRIKNLVDSHHFQQRLAKQKQVLESTIEQLKETESMLVQTEKMASLGRMSAGIIHEINNPLNYATTGLFTLRKKGKSLAPEEQEEYAEILHDVEEGIGRVKNIVSGLRVFSHPDAEQVDDVEVLPVLDSALEFLSIEWKNKVRIEKKLDPKQTVRTNRNKLLQVFVNLLQNSLDAVKEKPFEDGSGTAISIAGSVENGKSILSVRDNGKGIDENCINKVFDPFFTTKDVGEGMGLGLSICYRIVEEYGGRISVRSEHGKFTEFTMEFPMAEIVVAGNAE